MCLRLLEVISATTGCRFEIRHGGRIGLDAERESGAVLTPAVVDFCRDVFAAQGAILCGPGGGRFVYELRARFDLFCKLAPLRPLLALRGTGVMRPEAVRDVDILVVRENAGGLYLGDSGSEHVDGRYRAWQRFHYCETEVDRLLSLAIRAAGLRRGQLCVVTKPAGVPGISALWRARAEQLARGSGVTLRFMEIDTACYQLVADARRFDVVAAPNLFGDVLADGAGVLLGSRGLCYSANFTERGDAVYQTGHGAAYDLAGSDRANPGGQVLSLAMMLGESFARPDLRDAVGGALEDTFAAGWRTADVMSDGCRCIGTRELGDRIAAALASRLRAVPVPAGVAAVAPQRESHARSLR
ncbi:MAG: isocitrate/isopropylmalate family dehydrogenase [Gammaproteobacteria bacterium]|nr:isocitrate/isopropylmalate family dehydrogenase [Gammaproteobacteria bacterium]